MSDAPQGAGWWQASDGKWYPPEQHPSSQRPSTQSTRSGGVPWRIIAIVGGVLVFLLGLSAVVSPGSPPELPDGVTWEYDPEGDIAAYTASTSPDELQLAAEAIRAEVDVEDSQWIIFDCPGGSERWTATYRWAETAKGRAQIGVDDDDFIFEMLSTTPCAERGPPVTRNEAGGSMALDGDVPADAICRDLPEGCTPRPTVEQAAIIESTVASIYPGVPEGKATDRAIYTCSDIRRGVSPETLVDNVVSRYSGGSRPDMTPEQAQQVIDLIESLGFCTP